MNTEPSMPLSFNDWREELSKERNKSEQLSTLLKNQERNYQKLVGELKTQLQAEQQKSLSLENSLQKVPFTMSQVLELQSQLKQSEIRQKATKEEFKHKISELEIQKKEASDNNMSKELREFKDYAMNEITVKEKIIIEQQMVIDRSDSTIKSLSQELDYLQSLLLQEKQKYKIDVQEIQERVEELQDELAESRQHKEEAKSFHNKTQDDMAKHAKVHGENQQLKLNIENFQEELQLRTDDLKNAEKKILQLKQSRQELADTIEKLENKIEQLVIEKEDIIKGLKNKEETIQLLEEEIYTNAEGISETYKAELESANLKCKRLEKKLREIEQGYEDQLEEKMGIIAAEQIKINDLLRKISLLEKEKEMSTEKVSDLKRELSEYESRLFDNKQQSERENDKFKDKFKDKILNLKHERDELRLKLNELQDQMNFNRPSIIEAGGSLFDELAQLPEGRYSRISLRQPPNDDSKRIELLVSQLAEKEATAKSLFTEKSNLEIRLKESMTECRNLQDQLAMAVKHSDKLSQELEMTKWELDNLRSNEDAKLDKGKILVLESEKELIKAEISRLETELMLSKENWAELNNGLYKDLLESQAATANAKSELIRCKEELDSMKTVDKELAHKKKRSLGSWFGRKN